MAIKQFLISPGGRIPNSCRRRPELPPSSATVTMAVRSAVNFLSPRRMVPKPVPPPMTTIRGPLISSRQKPILWPLRAREGIQVTNCQKSRRIRRTPASIPPATKKSPNHLPGPGRVKKRNKPRQTVKTVKTNQPIQTKPSFCRSIQRGITTPPCTGIAVVYGHLVTLGPEEISQLIGDGYRTVLPAGTTDPNYQLGFPLLDIVWNKKSQKIPGFCQESGGNRPF